MDLLKKINLGKILKFFILLLTIFSVISIPLWFIFSSQFFEPLFAKALKIKIDPSISGGVIISKIYDDTYDDKGDGSYQYPLHEYYNEQNISDLTFYEVYRPILSNSASEGFAYWQISVGLSKFINPFNFNSGFSAIQIAIYIDIDGNVNGSNSTYFENAEYIKFPNQYAWDIMILENGIDNDSSNLYYSKDLVEKYNIKDKNKDYDPNKGLKIRKIFVEQQNKIYFQIPLTNKFIQKILDGRKTYHWVFVGLYDPLGNGGWLNIKENSSLRYGGGLKWDNGPRIYDLIVPKGYEQNSLLNQENTDFEGYVLIPPIEVKGFNPYISYFDEAKIIEKEKSLSLNLNEQINSKLEELYKKAEEEEKIKKQISEKEIEEKLKSNDLVEKLNALFLNSRFDEAKILVEKILQTDPVNPVALAYKGSLIAMEGGKTKNPMQAINLVNKAYEYLNKADLIMEHIFDKLNENNSEILTQFGNRQKFLEYYIIVLSNRAGVSSSVPDEIFNKLDVAILDFKKIAKLYEMLDNKKEALLSLMQVALLLEKKGKHDEANFIWISLSKNEDLPAKIEIELIKRGFK